LFHSLRDVERFNDLWLLSGVNVMWRTHYKPKDAHTRTSLACESGWARVPMSQTLPCVECHVPDSADPGLARQGFWWGSARRRLAIGSYVGGRFQARLAYPHGHEHRQCEFCH
jgi:hypothetical protein